METNKVSLDSLTADGRQLNSEDNPCWAHRNFGAWVEQCALWLDDTEPETGLSADWSSLPLSQLVVGNQYDGSYEARLRFNQVVGIRLKWLGQLGQKLQDSRRATSLRTEESDALFKAAIDTLNRSFLPERFKSVILADIDDAHKSYHAESFKGCVVMLGAALEGIMLGTLQRSDVITHLATCKSPPGPIKNLGSSHPNLADEIGRDLGFEEYKVCIHDLIPGSDSLRVDNIQDFRNAIHPWKAIQEPLRYMVFDRPRALHFLGSFQKILEAICHWKP